MVNRSLTRMSQSYTLRSGCCQTDLKLSSTSSIASSEWLTVTNCWISSPFHKHPDSSSSHQYTIAREYQWRLLQTSVMKRHLQFEKSNDIDGEGSHTRFSILLKTLTLINLHEQRNRYSNPQSPGQELSDEYPEMSSLTQHWARSEHKGDMDAW
jgi:hypothetical protein